ncbi:glycosyltransferase [Clostridium luticellarii]|jgi:glycosyltransferase involved in cell wall biosynthesis|nr:glycosyltransferase [Clostridium luticellarii]MCI1946304.1 glycosyltransferase [Clostridium luticellarii]MCI1969503.1 glycosyltransferase [Clostridium luticellarii]MCI1996680.1 glycosyltransferase [Clostridium luticellarii]
MIVKNESNTIRRCLSSVKNMVDEIIIVDTGSSDNTKDICREFTDKIYDFKWIDNFSAARNFSFAKATKDYILWLDADDILLPEDIEKFKAMKKSFDTSLDSVTMKYNTGFDEYGNITLSYRRNRLVKASKNFKWIGFVHEYLEVYGKTFDSNINITHGKISYKPNRNIEIYESKIKEGIHFSLRDILYYGHELYDHSRYIEAIQYYSKFLDSNEGWSEDKIRVCNNIADYYLSVNKPEDARKYVFKSFEYDNPRAEGCCRIGFSFIYENKLAQAVFWYEMALKLEKPKNSLGFFNDACWTWLPHLQLCVCYDRLGNHKLACDHNEMAGKFRPNDKRILFNKQYFKNLGI